MSKTLATVNGKVITDEDIDLLLSTLPPQQAATYSRPEARLSLLEELVAQELFYSEAKATDMENEEEFQQELAIEKEKMLKSYSIRKMLNQVSISDEAAQKFYEEGEENFQQAPQFGAKHILVPTKDEHDAVLKHLEEGANFSELAKVHSTCPSRDRGGDLGTFFKGQMVKEFDDALETMDVGEIRGDVKTTYGYHIIELVDKQPARTIPYEEVKDKIKEYLRSNQQSDLYTKKIEELKTKYPVLYMD
jgi:peptidyl-prolyl cis-trans isomerase C